MESSLFISRKTEFELRWQINEAAYSVDNEYNRNENELNRIIQLEDSDCDIEMNEDFSVGIIPK